MGNDLKYGLVFGLVILLIFIGWVAIKRPASEPTVSSDELVSDEVTEDVDFWAPPPVDVAAAPRPPQTAQITMGPADAVESVAPLMPGSRSLVDDVVFQEDPADAAGLIDDVDLGASPRTYVIAKGDDLGKVSMKFYNTTRKWKLIADANRDVLPDPNDLTVGTEIVIPPLDETPVPAAGREPSVEPGPRPQASSSRTHTVAKGDTLYKIAFEYYGDGNQFKKIYEANKDKLSSPDALKVGMTLNIP